MDRSNFASLDAEVANDISGTESEPRLVRVLTGKCGAGVVFVIKIGNLYCATKICRAQVYSRWIFPTSFLDAPRTTFGTAFAGRNYSNCLQHVYRGVIQTWKNHRLWSKSREKSLQSLRRVHWTRIADLLSICTLWICIIKNCFKFAKIYMKMMVTLRSI